MPIRVLVTYATAGAGHRRAAEAIAQAVRAQQPSADVQCVDVLDYTPPGFREAYARTYFFLVRYLSWVWRISYALLDHDLVYRCVQPLRRCWNLWIARRFVTLLNAQPPDAVIATHFLAADVCSAGKLVGWFRGALVVVVTDLHPHWFWVSQEPDAIVVAAEESRALLQRRGIAPARIYVIGIPVGEPFGTTEDPAALRRRWDLAPERLTVLVTSGGTTVGRFEQVVHDLLALEVVVPGRLQLLVVCGDDTGTQQRLTEVARRSPMPVRVFGFVDYMAQLMAVSDLIVAKAGGLTVSEALARGVPLILYHIIPGQEQMNAHFVVRQGAGVIAESPHHVAEMVRQLVTDASRLEAMRQSARRLGRPNAAREIVARVVQPLLQSVVHSP